MYWPPSTISEILRSTARLESRYASSRLKVVALDQVIDHRAHGALGGDVGVAADASGPVKRCRVDAWGQRAGRGDLPPDRLTRRQMTGATGGTENVLFAVRGRTSCGGAITAGRWACYGSGLADGGRVG
jgi:hypothetical protein